MNALENFGFLSLESLKTVSVFLFGSSRENEDAYQQIYVILESFLLAIRCLSALNRFEDAVLLFSEVFREGMVTEEEVITLLQRSKLFQENLSSKLHVLSALFCLVGKCHNSVGNSEIAWNFMLTAVKLDCACLEAFEFLLNESDLSQNVSVKLFEFIRDHSVEREALVTYYKSILVDQQLTSTPKFKRSLKINFDQTAKAYNCFVNGLYEEAYRICREIYCCDPFDEQCLVIYIGSMVELSLKGELYYLGHELVSNFPKLCLSWYCIGCYYWTCSNYEVALKYIQKCTKMEKDKNYMWILLGHILSAQEENEQAIAAYRCAGRLKTTDHRPLIFMAKEFVKTNCLSLSFQTLRVASNICPSDPLVFNELGIVCERLGNLDMAQRYFQVAAGLLETASTQIESRRVRSFEVSELIQNGYNYSFLICLYPYLCRFSTTSEASAFD